MKRIPLALTVAIALSLSACTTSHNDARTTQSNDTYAVTSTPQVATWAEPNAEMPSGYEIITGDVALMPPGATRIEEDSPLWDCHTMGNGVCGTTAR